MRCARCSCRLPQEQGKPLFLDLTAQCAVGRFRVQPHAIHVQQCVRILDDIQNRLPVTHPGHRANNRQIYIGAFTFGSAGAGAEQVDRFDEGQGLQAVDERVVGQRGCQHLINPTVRLLPVCAGAEWAQNDLPA